MYVTPRPNVNEDPLYAVRLALTGMLAYAAVPILDPALPPIIAALPLGLIAAQRKAFNPAKIIAAPVVMIVMVYATTWFVEQLRPMPLVYVGTMWLVYFVAFRMILKTGAAMGMLIIIVALLMSIMGMHGTATLETMRDGFAQASVVALVVGLLVYILLPARTKEIHVDEPVPTTGNLEIGAAIRATVLIGLSFWLYSVMQPSDMMMAMVAAMVIVFPTGTRVWDEAFQRIRATLYGAVVALLILWLFTFSAHLSIVLGLIFLSGLFFGTKMLNGPHPSMVYQYAFSVTLALVAGALSTQDPAYATFTRIVLTLVGAFTAAFTVAGLDMLTQWRGSPTTDRSSASEMARG
ncbi:fusaric acid resistance family protein [Litoreibacter halocynthiae]|uniref:Fusaric acid resistance family protein n=1 Tax=Litoreibacter halocynthiae TaxID=1242689 RepID=A0A4R7LPE8_9RHOB|nr:FUSC family protein [Litoreibacter halocynthiae]TDT77983.1 fusaric acid resistance family protein [Litoreibacter halocynthiae]